MCVCDFTECCVFRFQMTGSLSILAVDYCHEIILRLVSILAPRFLILVSLGLCLFYLAHVCGLAYGLVLLLILLRKLLPIRFGPAKEVDGFRYIFSSPIVMFFCCFLQRRTLYGLITFVHCPSQQVISNISFFVEALRFTSIQIHSVSKFSSTFKSGPQILDYLQRFLPCLMIRSVHIGCLTCS